MTGTSVHKCASDEKQALHRIKRSVLPPLWRLLLLPAFVLPALGARMGEMTFWLLISGGCISVLRTSLSDRSLRMLPVSRLGLATSCWLLTAGYPVALIAETSALHALYWTYSDDAWNLAWGRAIYSFSWFLLIDAVIVAMAALGFSWRGITAKHDKDERSPWSTEVNWGNVFKQILPVLFMLYVLVFPLEYPGPHTKMMLFNLVVGGIAFVVSYLLRERLITEHPRSATEEARRVEFGLTWSTPGLDPWLLALLKHMSGTAVWAACIAGLTVAVCTSMLSWPDYRSLGPDSPIGVAIAGGIISISLVWIPWNAELRAWRMLPLSRAQLGAAVVGFMAASCLVPWVLVFITFGSFLATQEFLAFNVLFSLLGISVLAQGMVMAFLPLILRGGDVVGTIPWIMSLLTAILFLFFGGFLLVVCKQVFQSPLATHGLMWMSAGSVVLCAGACAAVWHAGRVLRHDSCYGKATE